MHCAENQEAVRGNQIFFQIVCPNITLQVPSQLLPLFSLPPSSSSKLSSFLLMPADCSFSAMSCDCREAESLIMHFSVEAVLFCTSLYLPISLLVFCSCLKETVKIMPKFLIHMSTKLFKAGSMYHGSKGGSRI